MTQNQKICHQNFLTLNGLSYSFEMNNYLDQQLKEDDILTEICKTISIACEQEFKAWKHLPKESCRVVLVTEANDLYQYLGAEDRHDVFNFLIFDKPTDCSIKIIHFGPIGKKHDSAFTEQLDNAEQELSVLKEILTKLKSPENTKPVEEQEESKNDILANVKADYWVPLCRIETETESKKSELVNLTDHVCENAETRENAYKLIGKINVSASTGKIVLKSITAILFAELAEEIAKKFGIKTAAKTASKVGAKIGSAGGSKWIMKAMPFMGLAVGTAFGAWRVWQGDLGGAGLEIASGAAACMPGSGTAASLAIDGILMAKDIAQVSDESNENIKGINSQVQKLEYDLNELYDAYEIAVSTYKFVERIVEDVEFSIEYLENEIQTRSEILAAVQGPVVTVEGLPVTIMGSTGSTEFDGCSRSNEMGFVVL